MARQAKPGGRRLAKARRPVARLALGVGLALAAASFASGEYITIHTHVDELLDGTNRSAGVKSTDVTPSLRRTSAWTLIDDWSGEHGLSHVPGPYLLVAGSHTDPDGKTTAWLPV